MENRKIDLIREVVYRVWEKGLPKLKKRDRSLETETSLVNDIVGVRRSGKTSMMFLTMGELSKRFGPRKTVYINFEDRRLLPLDESYFNAIVSFIHSEKLLEDGKVYLFLDEVQHINGWEKYVRSIYDEFKNKIKIFVSGSSQSLLSKEYAELLTGRHITTVVFPLSFSEFLVFKGFDRKEYYTEEERAVLGKLLEEYLEFGGFPEVVQSREKEQILEQLFYDIITRDVLGRVSLKKPKVMEDIAYYICSNIANPISFSRFSRMLGSRGIKISVPTLENYFRYLQQAFLFFDVPIFSYSVKNQLQYPRKIYCVDNGLANVVGFRMAKNLGKLCENAVAIELLRWAFEKPARKIFYWRDRSKREVDFVLKEGADVVGLIQVCLDLSDPDVKKREMKPLLKAMEEFRLKRGVVLTGDLEGSETMGSRTIEFKPLWKWLLEKS
ncbi:MAG: ATP-binding protein [Candidatus Hadarchaeales archaeon]